MTNSEKNNQTSKNDETQMESCCFLGVTVTLQRCDAVGQETGLLPVSPAPRYRDTERLAQISDAFIQMGTHE